MSQYLLKVWQDAANKAGPVVKAVADRALQTLLTKAAKVRVVLDVRLCLDLPGTPDDPGLRLRLALRPAPGVFGPPTIEAPRMDLLTDAQREELRINAE